MLTELKRGMLLELPVERSTSGSKYILIMTVNQYHVLYVDIITPEAKRPSSKSLGYEKYPDEFMGQFFCEELHQVVKFPPHFESSRTDIFEVPINSRSRCDLSNMKLKTNLEENTLTNMMVIISTMMVSEPYRMFHRENGGRGHELGFWRNHEIQIQFLKEYESKGPEYVGKKYSISAATVSGYRSEFQKLTGIQVSRKCKIGRKRPEDMKKFLADLEEHGTQYTMKKYGLAKSSVYGNKKRYMEALHLDRKRIHNRDVLDMNFMTKFLKDIVNYGIDGVAERYHLAKCTVYSYRYRMRKRLQELGMAESELGII